MTSAIIAAVASLALSAPAFAQETAQDLPSDEGAPPPSAAEPQPTPAPAGPAQPAAGEPQDARGAPRPAVKRFSLGFWGALPFGENLATAITPMEASVQVNSMDTSWALGIFADYAVTPEIHAFVDGGMYSQSVEVAKPDSYGSSFWVYEMRDYTDPRVIGPFPDGVRYFMDATAIRLGGAYHVNLGRLDGFAGLTFGFYRWTATYGTPDRSGKYGQATGVASGLTYLLGADVPIGEMMKVGAFVDLASPAAGYTMKDLFQTGWTWTTEGHHVMGPYRIGLRILMPM